MKKAKMFTQAQIDWLIENNNPELTIREITEKYNAVFGEDRSIDTMKHKMKRLGLQRKDKSYSEIQNNWLRENAPNHSIEETATLFNEQFGENRNAGAIKAQCLKLGLKRSKRHVAQKYPIGSEVKLGSGYIYVKVSEGHDSFYKDWIPKHKIVYEQHFGKLPDGYQIIFLDHDHSNCNPDNLYAVNGRILREMSKKRWFSSNPEITLAAIKWCELFYALKGATT